MSSSNRGMKENQGSVGLVQRKILAFAAPPDEMVLESGARLARSPWPTKPAVVSTANAKNAILILHALSVDAHVAGYHTPDDPKHGVVGLDGWAGQAIRYGSLFYHLLQRDWRLSGPLPVLVRSILPPASPIISIFRW
jgi:homoserine O-acetyltransferase